MKAIRINCYWDVQKKQVLLLRDSEVVGTIRVMKMCFRFGISRRWTWRLQPSGVLRRVVRQKDNNISDEPVASIFMVIYLKDGEKSSTPWHWRCMQHVSPKRWSAYKITRRHNPETQWGGGNALNSHLGGARFECRARYSSSWGFPWFSPVFWGKYQYNILIMWRLLPS
jgi:hypothetical protein